MLALQETSRLSADLRNHYNVIQTAVTDLKIENIILYVAEKFGNDGHWKNGRFGERILA